MKYSFYARLSGKNVKNGYLTQSVNGLCAVQKTPKKAVISYPPLPSI